MKRFRSVIFWLHLVCGLVAGIAIAIMSSTGVALAFEEEIVAWAEHDVRRVVPPANAETARLSLEEMQRRMREAQPELGRAGITLLNDPRAAVAFTAGREGGFYVNPFSGEIRQSTSTKVRGFMRVMTDWHRWLGRDGDNRAIGKAINGACNIAFFALAVTGLYIWWPRNLSWRGVKAVALFRWNLCGKARDFNWHNSIGFWCAPVLIVLTLTAIPISYRWGGNLIYTLVGETPPAFAEASAGRPAQPGPGGAGGSTTPAVEITRPSPDARPLGYDAIVAAAQKDFPAWEQITLRSGGAQRGQRANAAGLNAPAATESRSPPSGQSAVRNPQSAISPQPITVTIRESGSWPRTATTTLTINPFTGEILRREGFGDLSTARQIRSWTRFLHTGQALGWGGQLIAGLACLGGVFLVYTGFALSWRRFFGRRTQTEVSGLRDSV